jgi:hypothetical protein
VEATFWGKESAEFPAVVEMAEVDPIEAWTWI